MEPTIRIASERDLPAIERVVYDAYKGYIPLTGKPPAPMSDDYGRQIEAEPEQTAFSAEHHSSSIAQKSPVIVAAGRNRHLR
jgi:hypothetical protein